MSSRWYPIYQKGNPQLRVFLPNFWMKMVKPDYNQYGASTPSNKVQFIVSSQMTKHDVKNYLEKIYQVDVADVRTLNKMGKTFRNQVANPRSQHILKEDDYKLAFVTLTKDFEWPDLKIKGSDEKREEENKEELKTAKEKRKEGLRDEERKYRPHVPPFFGL